MTTTVHDGKLTLINDDQDPSPLLVYIRQLTVLDVEHRQGGGVMKVVLEGFIPFDCDARALEVLCDGGGKIRHVEVGDGREGPSGKNEGKRVGSFPSDVMMM